MINERKEEAKIGSMLLMFRATRALHWAKQKVLISKDKSNL